MPFLHARKPLRVLVVDDDAIVNELVQTQLRNLRYEIAGSAFDGPTAVVLTQQLHPDVVVMDSQMLNPQTNKEERLAGLQAARLIQERCPTPVILLTAYESPELLQQASAVGVGAYLIKPVKSNDLDRAIAIAQARFGDLMEQHRLNAELAAYDYSVSHDLKNPVGLILTTANWLVEESPALSETELRLCLHNIAKSAYRANLIVDSLLLLAQPGRITLKPLDMAEIVAHAQEGQALIIKDSHAEIITPTSWPVALGQAELVERIWDNYLSNAIKYGGKPPRVEFGATIQPHGQIRFWIRDNGYGLTPESQDRLFTAFERLPSGSVKGHGLGLSIARRIAEKLGGQVGVESQLGQGSTFWFTLPAAE